MFSKLFPSEGNVCPADSRGVGVLACGCQHTLMPAWCQTPCSQPPLLMLREASRHVVNTPAQSLERSMCGSVVPQASMRDPSSHRSPAPGGSSGDWDTHPRPDCSWWWAMSLNLLPRPTGAVGSLHSRWDLWMDASVFLVTPSVTFQYTLCSFNWTKWLKTSCYTVVKFHLFWFKMMILIRP